MSTQGDRLKEERERLGLNQTAFGAVGGVKKQAQLKYEKGERHPDSAYLEAVSAVGVDVLYVITGQRSQETLSDELAELVHLYQNAPIQVRAAVHGALTAGDSDIGKPNKTVVKNSHGGRIAGNNYYEGK